MEAEGERRERGSYLQMFINYGVGYICNGIWGREECNGDDPSGIMFVELFAPDERYMLWIDNNLWQLWCASKASDEKLNWGPTTLCAGKAPDKKLNCTGPSYICVSITSKQYYEFGRFLSY